MYGILLLIIFFLAPDSVLLRGSAQQPKEIALAWEKPLITNGPLSKYKAKIKYLK